MIYKKKLLLPKNFFKKIEKYFVKTMLLKQVHSADRKNNFSDHKSRYKFATLHYNGLITE